MIFERISKTIFSSQYLEMVFFENVLQLRISTCINIDNFPKGKDNYFLMIFERISKTIFSSKYLEMVFLKMYFNCVFQL